MTPFDFGLALAERLTEKQAEGPIHPLQSPAAGYREELFRQKQLEQQQQQAQQQQMTQQQAANLPQGPTATNYPNIGPAQQLEPHDLQGGAGAGQPAGQPAKAAALDMTALNNRVRDFYQSGANTLGDLATTYSVEGPVPAAAKGVSMVGGQMKGILRTLMAKYMQQRGGPQSVAGQIASKGLADKQAGLGSVFSGLGAVGRGAMSFGSGVGAVGRGAMDFGRGMFAATKPLTGLASGGFKGMGQGFQTAGKMMYNGGKFSPAAAAGAGLAAYGMYSSLQNPIQRTGTGIRLRSPISPPGIRFRSPVFADGGGVAIQSPIQLQH